MRRTVWGAVAGVTAVLLVAGVVVLGPGAIAGSGVQQADALRFEEVSEERGFEYATNTEEQYGTTRAAVYVSDYDGDGDPDVLAVGGDGPVLFENRDAEFSPSGALSSFEGPAKSAIFFDQEGDGWDDLLVFRMYGDPVFFDNREGSYHRADVGFDDTGLSVPVAATVADYDRDGCLDVFVVQNGDWTRALPEKERQASMRPGGMVDDREVTEDNGGQNRLFAGDCESDTFRDVTESALPAAARWSLAASFVDFTGDGYPDIHVANDYNFDYLYVNQNGTGFVAERIAQTNRNAMSSETADFNRDGQMDVFVTNIHFPNGTGLAFNQQVLPGVNERGNNLLINEDGWFNSEATTYKVRRGGWGWAAVAVDLDNNGRVDLVHTSKNIQTGVSTYVPTYPSVWTRSEEEFVRRNASRLGFEHSNGRGMAHLDVDGDGDQDLVIATVDQAPYRLYENQGAAGNWLQVDVRSAGGVHANNMRFSVTTDETTYYMVANSQADLNSQDSRVHHVGLGTSESATLRVEFPDGTVRELRDVDAGQRLTVYANGTVERGPPSG